jgi:RNA polymerase sigma-70 factor (ECF subfamily)
MAKRLSPFHVQDRVRGPWRAYLDALEPLRPELHRYCCRLTGNVWDGEDLVQDTLLRVFGFMGKIDADLTSPRAYFIRTATNLWIDRLRSQKRERAWAQSEQRESQPVTSKNVTEQLEVREAAGVLLQQLAPRERAAIVMKDVLGLSLEECAAMLKSSVGAVKSALHRGRERLEDSGGNTMQAPPRSIVERFTEALSTQNISALQTLCSSDLTVELVGGAQADDFATGQNIFKFAHLTMPLPGFGKYPRWQVVEYDNEPIILGFRTLNDVEGINEIHRFEVTDGVITHVRTYCFCPDTLTKVAADLGLKALPRPYRSPSAFAAAIYLPRLFLRIRRWWRNEQ